MCDGRYLDGKFKFSYLWFHKAQESACDGKLLFVLALVQMKFICERIVCMSIKISDESCVITDSFEDFATRSFKFS